VPASPYHLNYQFGTLGPATYVAEHPYCTWFGAGNKAGLLKLGPLVWHLMDMYGGEDVSVNADTWVID